MRIARIALVSAVILYEVVALLNGKPGDTISELIWSMTQKWPIIPFAVGVAVGHLFWYRQ